VVVEFGKVTFIYLLLNGVFFSNSEDVVFKLANAVNIPLNLIVLAFNFDITGLHLLHGLSLERIVL